MTYTLADIILEVRNRSDLNNSEFITDSEMTSYINYSLKELHGLLINSWGGDYFLDNTTVSVNAGAEVMSGSLPEDCLKIAGVDLQVGGKYLTLQPFNFNERNRASALSVQGQASGNFTNYRYRVRNRQIVLTPAATGGVTLRVWYYPDAPQLVALTDEISVNDSISGWLEYVIVDVCIKCKQKEETDYDGFAKQKSDLVRRITAESQNRDAGIPQTVSDVYADGTVHDATGWGSNYGRWGW